MAYSFIKNKKGGVGVLLDSAADISLVPVDQFFPGTFAFTADGSARYRLSTSRSWVETAGGGDTPGGGWPEDLPLPSEGGYGYTDENENTHKIDSKYLPEADREIMLVEFSVDGSTYSANKTPKEIFDAVNRGAFVYAASTVSFGTQAAYTVYSLAAVGVEDEEYYTITFSAVQVVSGLVIAQSLTHMTDDPEAEPEWAFTQEMIPTSS